MHDFLCAILQSTSVQEIFDSGDIGYEALLLEIHTSRNSEFSKFKIPSATPDLDIFHPIENTSKTIFGNCPNCRNNICQTCRNNDRIIQLMCKRFDEKCRFAFPIQDPKEPESLHELLDEPMNKFEFLGKDRDLIIADVIKYLEWYWIRCVLDAFDRSYLESSHVDEAVESGSNLPEKHKPRQLEELSMKSTSTACDGNEVKRSDDIGSEVTIKH